MIKRLPEIELAIWRADRVMGFALAGHPGPALHRCGTGRNSSTLRTEEFTKNQWAIYDYNVIYKFNNMVFI